jgi:hypothetical protein
VSHNSHLSLPAFDTRKPRTVNEMEQIIRRRPLMGKLLNYFMTSLDNITSAPFVYLCKKPDPISIHHAVEYITNNEMTNFIYVVHFVDDRKAIKMRKAFLNKAREQVRRQLQLVLSATDVSDQTAVLYRCYFKFGCCFCTFVVLS